MLKSSAPLSLYLGSCPAPLFPISHVTTRARRERPSWTTNVRSFTLLQPRLSRVPGSGTVENEKKKMSRRQSFAHCFANIKDRSSRSSRRRFFLFFPSPPIFTLVNFIPLTPSPLSHLVWFSLRIIRIRNNPHAQTAQVIKDETRRILKKHSRQWRPQRHPSTRSDTGHLTLPQWTGARVITLSPTTLRSKTGISCSRIWR